MSTSTLSERLRAMYQEMRRNQDRIIGWDTNLFFEAIAALEAREPKVMPTYLSRDYNALYDLLCKGGEALGRRAHSESSPRFPIIVAEDIRPLHVPFWHAMVRAGRDRFLSECQRLNLEWVAPLDRSRMIEAGDVLVAYLHEASDMAVIGPKPSEEWHRGKMRVILAWDEAKK